MLKIGDKESIHITRGDMANLEVSCVTPEGTAYTFQPNDEVCFRVMQKKDCLCVLLKKCVRVEEECTKVTIALASSDTRIGDPINTPKVFWYEVELNPDTAPQTIVGYDEDGAKEFVIYPEGVEIDA